MPKSLVPQEVEVIVQHITNTVGNILVMVRVGDVGLILRLIVGLMLGRLGCSLIIEPLRHGRNCFVTYSG